MISVVGNLIAYSVISEATADERLRGEWEDRWWAKGGSGPGWLWRTPWGEASRS